jgi:inosine-uridine nucleoside N-ribohydrolase
MPRPVIIDTDPGTDDLFAVYLAHHLCLQRPDEFVLVGLIATYGNAPLVHTYANLVHFASQFLPHDIPVHWGARQPLHPHASITTDYFGANGLCDAVSVDTQPFDPAHDGIKFVLEQSLLHGGALEYIALGPCSTLASALQQDDGLAQRLRRVTLMGGTLRAEGNIGPVQEFNFACDPEAVDVVLQTIPRVLVLPWEVCLDHDVSLSWYEETLMRHDEHNVHKKVVSWLRHVNAPIVHKMQVETPGRYVFCDPLCVLAHLEEEKIVRRHRDCWMRMELNGSLTRGMNVNDFSGFNQGSTSRAKNASLIIAVDIERAQQALVNCLQLRHA